MALALAEVWDMPYFLFKNRYASDWAPIYMQGH